MTHVPHLFLCWTIATISPVIAGDAKDTPDTKPKMVFPDEDWTVTSPESQGVKSDKLNQAVRYLKKHSGSDGVRELVIIRNGYLIWQGNNIDKQHGVWSITKTFTSSVLGLLIEDGKVTLNTRAKKYVPALAADYPTVTLRHFTTMTSGYQAEGDEPRGSYSHGPSKTPFQPAKPLFKPPGSKFAYWDSAMNEFALVLTKAAGKPLEEVFKQRIANPIGMDRNQWNWGDLGKVDGVVINCGSGNSGKHIKISARELARLGHLYLNKGRWKGKQLISADWVAEATTTQVPATTPLGAPRRSDIHGPGVYGYNWWTNGIKADGKRQWPGAPKATYAAVGANNNDMFVIPPWNMVVVRLGMDADDQNISDEVYGAFLKKIGEALSVKAKD